MAHCDGDCCGCGHSHEHEEKRGFPWDLLSAGVLLLASLLPVYPDAAAFWVKLALCGASVLLAGWPVFRAAGKSIWAHEFDETLLMSIAALAAFAIGDFAEGAAVVLFFRLGELLEDSAEKRSRREISALADIRPDEALLLTDDTVQTVPAQDVAVGALLQIPPHARVPLDGVVLSGSSTLDTAALTGESLPREATEGTPVLSGMVNGAGLLTIRTTAAFGDSAASRILQMVEEAQGRRSKTQKLIAKFAKIYTPSVVGAAALVFVLGALLTGEWVTWLTKSLAFLVASCPCALVLSVPLAYFAGMGAAAKQGVIIKGGTFLDALATADTFAFDKTGTLTSGTLTLAETLPLADISAEEALRLAAICEHYSEHPLAVAIRAAAQGDTPAPDSSEEIPAGGTVAQVAGQQLLCGGKRLLTQYGVDATSLSDAPVYLAVDGVAAAAFRFASALRPGAAEISQKLKKNGVQRTVLLTGDTQAQADVVAQCTQVDEVYAQLLPADKLHTLTRLGGITAFVGDGVNDTPSLAAADVGIAMGLGTQAASEAADVLLLAEDLSALAEVRALAQRTRRIVAANIAFSLAAKAAVLLWAVLGDAPIAAAVFADVGVLALTVLNAARLLRQ
ncbi:MAG: cadmium-translocating P-type ATPase [Oscillospiraceae bacterium]|jgi:Cd2+/Zn2+-exporting ATPase|nr:cadmium-translocating P-type ATPase [Oscillospiraceae bacterium]